MKQVLKTEKILSLLRASLGDETAVDSLKVYEAIAFNTLPVRKKHPLYKGARADRSLLVEMAQALKTESRPVHIQHNNEPLPIGRVFHGEVLDDGQNSELRVLFFLDATANTEAEKIDSGSVDQVSVSVLSQQLICSASGFDFLGPDATFDHIWSGTDPDGNTIGENGVYNRMVGLDDFFELSLVGRGGAQNARIISREQSHFGSSLQRLAATGVDPNSLILVASAGKEDMDLTELIKQLTDTKAELALKTTAHTDLETQVATLTAKVAELTAELAKEPEANPDLELAIATLSGIATNVLTASGKLDAALPTTVAELNTLITTESEALKLVLKSGGASKGAVDDIKKPAVLDLSGYRSTN